MELKCVRCHVDHPVVLSGLCAKCVLKEMEGSMKTEKKVKWKVVSPLQLPTRLPFNSTAIVLLMLDRYDLMWSMFAGVTYAVLFVLWCACIYAKLLEEPVKVFTD